MDARAALLGALKEELRTTELARISVARLAIRADVTRQAFYYHFDDVFHAAEELFQEEVARHILEHSTYEEWSAGFEQMLTYMFQHRTQAQGVLNSLPTERTVSFFFRSLREMMRAIVDQLAEPYALEDSDRQFIIDHYTLAVVGHLLHWISRGMTQEPGELVERIQFVMQGHVLESIERYAKN